jgi:hypothetical protein
MRLFTSIRLVLINCGLLLLLAGCGIFVKTTYRPSCDLQPVLTMKLPNPIETFAGCPRDKTIVENGINKIVGGRQADDIKELFWLTKGDAEYEFDLFFSESAAVHWYESEKNDPFTRKYRPVFREITADNRSGCVHYTMRPQGEWGLPVNYYYSRASFRLHNACISVTTQDDKPRSDNLTIAVGDLAQMLGTALASTNQMPK